MRREKRFVCCGCFVVAEDCHQPAPDQWLFLCTPGRINTVDRNQHPLRLFHHHLPVPRLHVPKFHDVLTLLQVIKVLSPSPPDANVSNTHLIFISFSSENLSKRLGFTISKVNISHLSLSDRIAPRTPRVHRIGSSIRTSSAVAQHQ